MSATETNALPGYAPVPRSALGPALNEQGYPPNAAMFFLIHCKPAIMSSSP